MQVGAVDQSASPSTVGPSISEVGKDGAAAVHYAEEDEAEWMLGVDEDIAGVDQPTSAIMVDSGAVRTVFRKGDFQAKVEESGGLRPLLDINGNLIKQYGVQTPHVTLPSGRQGGLSGVCAGAKKSALAVSSSCDNGNTLVFSHGKSFITKHTYEPPPDAEMMERRGQLFYLPVSEVQEPCRRDGYVVAPAMDVESVGPLPPVPEGAEQQVPAAAEQPPPDEFDEGYDRAVQNNEALPFGRFEREDVGSKSFRMIRKTDPCGWDQVFRRKTIDMDSNEKVADEFKADVEVDHKWRQRLPGAPRSIRTTFYYYVG